MKLISRIEGEDPESGTSYLWFLGGSSFAIKFHDQPVIYTDLDAYAALRGEDIPLSGLAPGIHIDRRSFLPIDPHDISEESAYLSSHDHSDHCDRETLLAVIDKGGVLIGPKSSCDKAASWGIPPEKIVKLDGDKYDKTTYGKVEIYAAPGRDINATSSNIHLVSYDGICILHNGDSLYDGSNYLAIADRFKKIDVALINLGKNGKGRQWYHTPYDVVRAANDLGPRFLICHHYDKWYPLVEDPMRVSQVIETSYPEVSKKTQFKILKNGERFDISVQKSNSLELGGNKIY